MIDLRNFEKVELIRFGCCLDVLSREKWEIKDGV